MATAGLPQPGADAGGADQTPSAPPSSDQANSLQTTIGKLMQITLQLAQQNAVVQPELQAAADAFRKAFAKTTQAAQPSPQQAAPPQQ
jgi:hypothetical protein